MPRIEIEVKINGVEIKGNVDDVAELLNKLEKPERVIKKSILLYKNDIDKGFLDPKGSERERATRLIEWLKKEIEKRGTVVETDADFQITRISLIKNYIQGYRIDEPF